jgi:hypothetical protein
VDDGVHDERSGREFPPFRMVVEAGKVAEFRRAVGDDADDLLSPATFLMTQAFWRDEHVVSELGLDLSRVLHAGQSFEFPAGPPAAGTALTGRTRITDVWDKDGTSGRLTFYVAATEFRDDAGDLVAVSRTTGAVLGGWSGP